MTTDDQKPTESISTESKTCEFRSNLTWDHDDPAKPTNFSRQRKLFIVLIGLLAIFNATFDSSLPSGTIEEIAAYFRVESQVQLVLPVSVFLLGYVVGPLFWSPLSEVYGRRPVLVGSYLLFVIFTLACALAPNWASFLFFRWACGTFASSALTVVGGMYADIYDDALSRGRAMALFLAFTAIGPQPAPAVSGFVASRLGWRWVFWVGLIVSGASAAPMVCLPETFGPALLRAKARKSQQLQVAGSGNSDLSTPTVDTADLVRKSLTRPLRMLATEPLCIVVCVFVSYASAIFFLLFEGYPIIFRGLYHLSPGVVGLTFLPIAGGAACGFLLTLWYDSRLMQAKLRHEPWASVEEYRRLPLAVVGGLAYVISLLWLAWSARVSVHWAVPMMSGLVFGVGFMLIFSACLNYLADAYTIYAASALATASFCRSILGAVLPLAAPRLFNSLGIGWGNTLLAILSLALTMLPLLLIRWGSLVRQRSRMCQDIRRSTQG